VKIETYENVSADERVYVLRITRAEIETARLDNLDKFVLHDCEADDATISDTLLGLELLARRIEEGHRGQ